MKKICLLFVLICGITEHTPVFAQTTYPINGTHDERNPLILIRGANIYIDAGQIIENGEMLIQDGIILGIANKVTVPANVTPITIDMKGKFIYPAFVDVYTSFGLGKGVSTPYVNGRKNAPQYERKMKGAVAWNDAIHPQLNAYDQVSYDTKSAETLRKMGVAVVLSHQKDGIARGTGVLVSLNDHIENLSILKPIASNHLSFSKGSSTQDYPSSLMGSIALLRQTYLDANWYANVLSDKKNEGFNASLQAFKNNTTLPTFFEIANKWDALKADRIGDEFGQSYIIRATGSEYQIIDQIKSTNTKYVLPLAFPLPFKKVDDNHTLRFINFRDLKHWEMAPSNPYFFQEAGIPFCLTFDGIESPKDALDNLKKAISYGLNEDFALAALTIQPANFLGVADKVGSLSTKKMANFIVCNGPLFSDKTEIVETWVQGEQFIHNYNNLESGYFKLSVQSKTTSFSRNVRVENGTFYIDRDKDTTNTSPKVSTNIVKFDLALDGASYSFSGIIKDRYTLYGTANDKNLASYTWTMVWTNRIPSTYKKSTKQKVLFTQKDLLYPFSPYGSKDAPKQQNMLIKNVTIWTNTDKGILKKADVLVIDGKIASVGNNLSAISGATIIDGTNKHLTPGIIDEHSHIAITGGVNEGTQAVTAEVRIGDVINPEDINIYRQLSGGVTSSHILHGSANPIGGQTQLIKLRWGKSDHELKFAPWTPFIKFALGENVKQTNWGKNYNIRFPQTRMGVEQVFEDAFYNAKMYSEKIAKKEAVKPDLEMDALAEILNKKRFITCHSYVQSEINMLMRIATKYNFTVNTFTHVLEGYKVADKLKKHGANVSTFADWGTYKYEVNDATTYNASIMHKMGLNVAINSDDAEMGRRLNQEAAKMIKYGDIDEEEALKAITLNPAKMLHIDDRVGSIDVGKDADLVLWTDHPLSIYAEAEKTIIDGTIYYDKSKNKLMQEQVLNEKKRILELMESGVKKTGKSQPVTASSNEMYDCDGLINHPFIQ